MNNTIQYSKNNPLTLIFYGGNFLGVGIAETILREDGNVLIIDDFSRKNSYFFKKIKEFKNKNFKGEIKSIDLKFAKDIEQNIPNVDFCLFIGNFNVKTSDEYTILRSLENFFNITKKYNAKFLVIANINEGVDTRFSEIKKHIKSSSLKEITDNKGALIEIADVYGEDMDDFIVNPINEILQSVKEKKIIDIENLSEFHYYLYIDDAINGIIKVLFSQKEGEYTLSNKEDISNISLAFRISDILKINVKNSQIKPMQKEDRIKTISSNVEDWETQTSFEEGLKSTVLHKMAGEISNVYNINKGFSFENKKEIPEKHIFKKNNTLDIKNFDNIKNKYLKNEYINKTILTPERKKEILKRKIKKKTLKYSLIIILYIAIIAPFILSFIEYIQLNSNLKNEVVQIKNINSLQSINPLNKRISTEISTLNEYINLGYFILSPLSKYSPTKNILLSSESFNNAMYFTNYNKNLLKSFYFSSFSNSKKTVLQKINMGYLTSSGKIQISSANLDLNNKSILPSIKNTIANNISSIENMNLRILNSLNITYQMFSGKKYYTLIYLNTNNTSSVSGNIEKYTLVALYNGTIDNIISSPNAGDLNQIQSNTNIPQTSENISSRVDSAFKITNTGIIYITKNAQTSFEKILGKSPTIKNYSAANISAKSKIFDLLYNKYFGKDVIIYITDPKFQNINTLIY